MAGREGRLSLSIGKVTAGRGRTCHPIHKTTTTITTYTTTTTQGKRATVRVGREGRRREGEKEAESRRRRRGSFANMDDRDPVLEQLIKMKEACCLRAGGACSSPAGGGESGCLNPQQAPSLLTTLTQVVSPSLSLSLSSLYLPPSLSFPLLLLLAP